MKKNLKVFIMGGGGIVLGLALLCFVACQNANDNSNDTGTTTTTNSSDDVKGEGVMTYAEYIAAPLNSEVVVETYVQAKQSLKDNKASLYTQDKDGAYFIYSMACSQEEYNKLVSGTKIKVTGKKANWSGEIEIIDATFEILEGKYIAEAFDVTALLGTADLEKHQNKFVSFKGMKVEAINNETSAWCYKYDGSGQEGDDIYFNASKGGKTCLFTIESSLCDKDSDVYKKTKTSNIGDVVNMEGFLYWCNEPNPHITSIK